jgi:hypothetical protein
VKPVIQKEKTDCAIASVAALSGLSYTQAKKIANQMGVFVEDKKLWSETTYIRKILARLEIKTAKTEQPFETWEQLPDRALLAIKWHLENGGAFWHWVVFIRDGEESFVLDSKAGLKNNKRTDFGRIQPKWSIEVKG